MDLRAKRTRIILTPLAYRQSNSSWSSALDDFTGKRQDCRNFGQTLDAEQLTQSFTTDDDFTQTNNRGA